MRRSSFTVQDRPTVSRIRFSRGSVSRKASSDPIGVVGAAASVVSVSVVAVSAVVACWERGIVADTAIQRRVADVVVGIVRAEGKAALDTAKHDLEMMVNIFDTMIVGS